LLSDNFRSVERTMALLIMREAAKSYECAWA